MKKICYSHFTCAVHFALVLGLDLGSFALLVSFAVFGLCHCGFCVLSPGAARVLHPAVVAGHRARFPSSRRAPLRTFLRFFI
jgi:hypothetical protein